MGLPPAKKRQRVSKDGPGKGKRADPSIRPLANPKADAEAAKLVAEYNEKFRAKSLMEVVSEKVTVTLVPRAGYFWCTHNTCIRLHVMPNYVTHTQASKASAAKKAAEAASGKRAYRPWNRETDLLVSSERFAWMDMLISHVVLLLYLTLDAPAATAAVLVVLVVEQGVRKKDPKKIMSSASELAGRFSHGSTERHFL